jgi:ppGpp synthetase/RelA/SpoT-type nucleotidyltranferase
MIVPSAIRQRYDESRPFLMAVQRRVESALLPFCRKNGFVFEGRVKTLESVAEKVESGRYPSWEKLDDLYACTVAVPLADDERVAREFVEKSFTVLEVKERGVVPKPPDVFRFDSTRVLARLRKPPAPPLGKELSIHSIVFEIQIKSLFDFAWSKTTHSLTYKSGMVDWKRYRLTAHLKAAVEQADFLLVGFEQASQLVTEGRCPDIDDKATLKNLFGDLTRSGHIPPESVPKDWSRFIDNVYTALQVFEGNRPTSQGFRRLQCLDLACSVVREFFSGAELRQIPRSLSLFQIVLGALCSSGKFHGHSDHYYILTDDSFSGIFPGAAVPGMDFETRDASEDERQGQRAP